MNISRSTFLTQATGGTIHHSGRMNTTAYYTHWLAGVKGLDSFSPPHSGLALHGHNLPLYRLCWFIAFLVTYNWWDK